VYDPTVTIPKTWDQLITYVLMYGFFAALGTAGLAFFLILFFWPQWRVNALFAETEGTVVDQRETWSEGGTFRQVRLRYSVDGTIVENWSREYTLGMDDGAIQQRTRAMVVGNRYPIWYDPTDPQFVVVERGYWIHWMFYPILIGSGFFLLYGVGKTISGIRAFGAQRFVTDSAHDPTEIGPAGSTEPGASEPIDRPSNI
jgi:hypothetical protein